MRLPVKSLSSLCLLALVLALFLQSGQPSALAYGHRHDPPTGITIAYGGLGDDCPNGNTHVDADVGEEARILICVFTAEGATNTSTHDPGGYHVEWSVAPQDGPAVARFVGYPTSETDSGYRAEADVRFVNAGEVTITALLCNRDACGPDAGLGTSSVTAAVEDSGVLPACGDGVDGDGDGYADFPDDSGCDSKGDAEESNPTGVCDPSNATMVGTDGDDRLVGTDDDDFIVGGAGNDVILGGDGEDRLCGDEGDDRIQASQGGYSFVEDVQLEAVIGGPGKDVLSGGPGNDSLQGNDGDDRLMGQADFDGLDGGAGNDGLNGGSGRDSLEDGPGNDALDAGRDGAVIFPWFGNDSVDGGPDGSDLVFWSLRRTIHLDLPAGTLRGVGRDTVVGNSIRDVEGSMFGGSYILNSRDNELQPGAIWGGDVWIDTGAGSDEVVAGYNNGTVRLGPGRDSILNMYDDQSIYGGPGEDTIDFYDPYDMAAVRFDTRSGRASGYGRDLILGFELIYGSAFDDRMLGGDGDDQLFGDYGDDFLDGRGGTDLLDGGNGTDTCLHGETRRDCEE